MPERSETMNLRAAYIHLFGAAAFALEQLEGLGDKVACREIILAKNLLRDALAKTEALACIEE